MLIIIIFISTTEPHLPIVPALNPPPPSWTYRARQTSVHLPFFQLAFTCHGRTEWGCHGDGGRLLPTSRVTCLQVSRFAHKICKSGAKRERNVTATVDNMFELPQEVAAQKHGLKFKKIKNKKNTRQDEKRKHLPLDCEDGAPHPPPGGVLMDLRAEDVHPGRRQPPTDGALLWLCCRRRMEPLSCHPSAPGNAREAKAARKDARLRTAGADSINLCL